MVLSPVGGLIRPRASSQLGLWGGHYGIDVRNPNSVTNLLGDLEKVPIPSGPCFPS